MSLPDSNPKTKAGSLKPPLHTIPPIAIVHLGITLGDGADKYGVFNWREEAVSVSTYIGAIMRHLLAFADGENVDPESNNGGTHLGAIMSCAAILLDAEAVGSLHDDRPSRGVTAEFIRQRSYQQIQAAIEEMKPYIGDMIG